jgi:hypothetical protein
MCQPWQPTCTYRKLNLIIKTSNLIITKSIILEQPANCPCRNGGICVQLPSGNLGCSCRYGYTGDQCERSKFSLLVNNLVNFYMSISTVF